MEQPVVSTTADDDDSDDEDDEDGKDRRRQTNEGEQTKAKSEDEVEWSGVVGATTIRVDIVPSPIWPGSDKYTEMFFAMSATVLVECSRWLLYYTCDGTSSGLGRSTAKATPTAAVVTDYVVLYLSNLSLATLLEGHQQSHVRLANFFLR
jgi:hypothetical protein